MDKLLCVTLLVVTVLLCCAVEVGSTARPSNAVAKRTCNIEHASSAKECRSNATLPKHTNTSKNTKQKIFRKSNHKKTIRQYSPRKQKQQIEDRLQAKHVADTTNITRLSSNATKKQDTKKRIRMAHSKAKKSRAKTSKFSAKPDISNSDAKLTSEREKLLDENSQDRMVKFAVKGQIKVDWKIAKSSAKPEHPTTQRNPNGKNNKQRAYGKLVRYSCWFKNKKSQCRRIRTRRTCSSSKNTRFFSSEKECLAGKKSNATSQGTICWRKRNGICSQVNKRQSCAKYKTEELYGTKLKCESKKSNAASKGTICWQKRNGTCSQVNKRQSCAKYKTEKLYSTKLKCETNSRQKKCFLLNDEKSNCSEIRTRVNDCQGKINHYNDLDTCKSNIPQVKCFELRKSTSEKCHQVTVSGACDDKSYFHTKERCIDKYGYVKCYVPTHNIGECSEKYLENGNSCSEEKAEYHDVNLCKANSGLKKCFLLNDEKNACSEVHLQVGSCLDKVNHYNDLHTCEKYFMIKCYKYNATEKSCRKTLKNEPCSVHESAYADLSECEDRIKKQGTKCPDFNGIVCEEACDNNRLCDESDRFYSSGDGEYIEDKHKVYKYNATDDTCRITYEKELDTALLGVAYHFDLSDCENAHVKNRQ